MASRSLRCRVAVLAFAALLPVAALNAAQRHPRPAPTSAAHQRNPIIDFFLRIFTDAGPMIDGNG